MTASPIAKDSRIEGGPHSLAFMPQLDSLRALSVMAVLYTHYLPEKYWLFGIYWGELGVRCFFVISGFLIPSILLREFAIAGPSKPVYFAFILRRAFRLFPLLAVVLFVAALLGIKPVRESLIWHLLYLSNVYIVKQDAWPGPVSHLWSLAVEQQFYVFWPLIIAFVSRRLLPLVFLALVIAAPVYRLIWRGAGFDDFGAWVLPPSSFDALAMGALIALYRERLPVFAVVALVGLGIWLAVTSTGFLQALWWIKASEIHVTAAAIFFAWVIGRAAAGFRGVAESILNTRVLRYVGSISYGIYILHPFVIHVVESTGPQHPSVSILLSFAATLLLAALSWHLLELPIVRFGRRKLESRSRPNRSVAA